MAQEKAFVDGLFYNEKHPNAPEFVLGSISIKKDEFIQWLEKQDSSDAGYVKIDFKMSQKGKPYAELNTYQASR